MPTCQGQHPDGSPCRNPAPTGQARCYIHRRPDPAARLTPEDVLKAIEERGGPEGLDLSQEDLAKVDLGRVAIQEELHRRGLDDAPWYSQDFGGLDLVGTNLQRAKLWWADFQGACLQRADLSGAFLMEAKLQEVELGGAYLQKAYLTDARLQRASLSGARLRGANLVRSSLQKADFVSANLQEADFWQADLQGANLKEAKLERVDLSAARDITRVRWYGAVLDKTRMRREQLGEKIRDELAAEKGERGASYYQAREAYLALKTNFNELGRYDDASWAYRKERRMERAMSRWRRWKWWWDGVAEWLTDYGENPWLAIRAVLIVWFVFGLLYSSVGSIGPADLLKAEPVKVFDPGAIFGGFTYSLAALGTVGLESLHPLDRLTEVLTAIEGIFGISLLALLMFTLGNRISRS